MRLKAYLIGLSGFTALSASLALWAAPSAEEAAQVQQQLQQAQQKLTQQQQQKQQLAGNINRTQPVPFIYVGRPANIQAGGALKDIAPSMLAMLGIAAPAEMTGHSLIEFK